MKPSRALPAASIAAFLALAGAGSAPAATLKAADLGPAPAARPVSFLVKLPLRNRAELEALTTLQATPGSPLYHHFLTVAQFQARYGPTADSFRHAEAALAAQGLRVTGEHSQTIEATGTVAAVQSAFNVHLRSLRDTRGRLRSVTAEAARPVPALAGLGAVVIGLQHSERRSHALPRRAPLNRDSTLGNYWFDDLKQAYAYPSYTVANGTGISIATVGVSDFSADDADLYFLHERLGPGGSNLAPQPTLYHRIMNGGSPFSTDSNDSFEADLDVQQAGGSAPGATIIGIATDGTDPGFINAYTYIDDKKTGFAAQVVSTSYGECELAYTAAYDNLAGPESVLTSGYHDVFLQGNSEGITFVTSSGDNAGLDCPQPGYFLTAQPGGNGSNWKDVAGVEADADDPNVVAVGGTNLTTVSAPPSLTSTYASESAYNDFIGGDDPYGTGNNVTNELWGSGGGASQIFAKPAWQNDIPTGVSTRAVPDIAMHMGGLSEATDSADYEYFGGSLNGVIGTSASSPEFAGLIAVRESASHQLLGNLNADLYSYAKTNSALAHKFFRQGIPGNNGVVAVPAGRLGYNTILGVGTPYGANFAALPTVPLAGIPQTGTNP